MIPTEIISDALIPKHIKRNPSLRDMVITLRKDSLCKTSAQISREVGCSRERVRQILNQYKLPTKRYTKPKYICPICKKWKTKYARTCASCHKHEGNIELVCSYCGKLFSRFKSQVIYKSKHGQQKWFCSHKCRASDSRVFITPSTGATTTTKPVPDAPTQSEDKT